MNIHPNSHAHDRERVRLAWWTLVVGVSVYGAKITAWRLTGSAAVMSDAFESTANVAAAVLLLISLRLVALSADHNHPYGHGKVEFFSSGVEGALIVGAALWIVAEAVRQLIGGAELRQLDLGIWIVGGSTLLNGLWGRHLIRASERLESPALLASGAHLITDVYTSVGALIGLALVHFTGLEWLDGAVAIALAISIVRTGYRLMRSAVAGLMHETDPAQIARLVGQLDRVRDPAWIDIHNLRAWRAGKADHVDLHVVVPRYFDVDHLERLTAGLEETLLPRGPSSGEVTVRYDPCRERHCVQCSIVDCPVRADERREHFAFTPERLVGTESKQTGSLPSGPASG